MELKKYLTPKNIAIVGGGVALGLIFIFKKKNSSSPTVENSSPIPSLDSVSSSQLSSAVDSLTENIKNTNDKTLTLIDSNNESISSTFEGVINKINSVDTSSKDRDAQISSSLSSVTSSLVDKINAIHFQDIVPQQSYFTNASPTSISNSQNPTLLLDEATKKFNSQVESAKQIFEKKSEYTSTYAKYNSDGNISASEREVLNTIHNQAEVIGINAGFGTGGGGGNERVIPDAVKKASGLN